jgi:hypothetical protein
MVEYTLYCVALQEVIAVTGLDSAWAGTTSVEGRPGVGTQLQGVTLGVCRVSILRLKMMLSRSRVLRVVDAGPVACGCRLVVRVRRFLVARMVLRRVVSLL